MIEPKQRWRRYHTPNGICINEDCEKVIQGYLLPNYTGKIQLILTSPPFPLKRAKKYGNKVGTEYLEWLCNINCYRDWECVESGRTYIFYVANRNFIGVQKTV